MSIAPLSVVTGEIVAQGTNWQHYEGLVSQDRVALAAEQAAHILSGAALPYVIKEQAMQEGSPGYRGVMVDTRPAGGDGTSIFDYPDAARSARDLLGVVDEMRSQYPDLREDVFLLNTFKRRRWPAETGGFMKWHKDVEPGATRALGLAGIGTVDIINPETGFRYELSVGPGDGFDLQNPEDEAMRPSHLARNLQRQPRMSLVL